jgi:hypothetical protein
MIAPDVEIPITFDYYERVVKQLIADLKVGDMVIVSSIEPNTMRWFYAPFNQRTHLEVDHDQNRPAILITNIEVEIIDEEYVFGAIEALYDRAIFRLPFLDLGMTWTLSKASR